MQHQIKFRDEPDIIKKERNSVHLYFWAKQMYDLKSHTKSINQLELT
jgi:hypothetical protein